MCDPVPFGNLFHESHRAETKSVPPYMSSYSNFEIQAWNLRLLSNLIDIFDEFEIELVEVCLNIDAL